jgi:low temperature requirement protein LtrA
VKALLWWIALGVGFFGPLFVNPSGWHVQPAHFVERHSLIVIIAIGESLVAIGIGARGTGLGAGVIVAAVLGFFVAASFWLAYFDFFTIRAQHLLAERSGTRQTALARDAYTYLHLPMVVGIVLFAFGLKTTLAHVGHELAAIPALCLCCGPALYLLGYVGVRARVSHQVFGGRFIAAIACAALVPVALTVPAMVALACLAAVWGALHAYELIWWRDARAETRALGARASAS